MCTLIQCDAKIYKVTLKEHGKVVHVSFMDEDELELLRHAWIFGGTQWDDISIESIECAQ